MRKAVLPAVIIITSILLIVRIFYLQVIDENLKLQSENNAIKKVFDCESLNPRPCDVETLEKLQQWSFNEQSTPANDVWASLQGLHLEEEE